MGSDISLEGPYQTQPIPLNNSLIIKPCSSPWGLDPSSAGAPRGFARPPQAPRLGSL
jgi:hypothetical protein